MSFNKDNWLSERLGKPAHLCDAAPEQPPAGFSYAKVDTRDFPMLERLQRQGFIIVVTSVTFETPLPLPPQQASSLVVRHADPEDEEHVVAIARSAFSFDRFHSDPYIPDDIADDIKGEWTRNFFKGRRGDFMIVAQAGDDIAGFLLLLDKDDVLVIDLIGVAPAHQKKGAGKAMVSYAANSFGSFSVMRVGTQVANTPSVRFYEHLGFRLVAAKHVLHCHNPLSSTGGDS